MPEETKRKKGGATVPAGPRSAAQPARARAKRASDPAGSAQNRNIVQSLAKGFAVLQAFTATRPELTLSEVAAEAHLDPGTAFRMLGTLEMLGYVARVPDSRRFRLTLQVLDLGFHAIGRTEQRDLVRPILRSLVGDVGEASSFAVLDGVQVLYLERVRAGMTRLGVDIRVGTAMPATHTAIGHCILAFLPEAEQARIIDAVPGSEALGTLSMTREDIVRSIAKVRRDGYAARESALTQGIRILAAPVRGQDGYPLGAISVAAPSVRVSEQDFLANALTPLLAAAETIGRAIGASGGIGSSYAAE